MWKQVIKIFLSLLCFISIIINANFIHDIYTEVEMGVVCIILYISAITDDD